MFELKIVWAIGKHGKQLPVIYKLFGEALGVVVTILLLLFADRLCPHCVAFAESVQNGGKAAKPNTNQPVPSNEPARATAMQEVMYLTYARPRKR